MTIRGGEALVSLADWADRWPALAAKVTWLSVNLAAFHSGHVSALNGLLDAMPNLRRLHVDCGGWLGGGWLRLSTPLPAGLLSLRLEGWVLPSADALRGPDALQDLYINYAAPDDSFPPSCFAHLRTLYISAVNPVETVSYPWSALNPALLSHFWFDRETDPDDHPAVERWPQWLRDLEESCWN